MISEFEQRLADVLGARLPAPFAGRVEVAPGPGPDTEPLILVGARRVKRVEPDIGSQRPEIVPGSDDRRRVLRLRCTVSIQVHPGTGEGRQQQMGGLDAALHALDAPDFRDGSALIDGGDPGFVIHEMRVIGFVAPLDPGASDAPPTGLTLSAEGWFWPVGVAGEAGRRIGEIRVRGVTLPLEILPAAPALVAGGPAVELTLRLRAVGPLRLDGQAEPLPPLPFGSLALALAGPGGRPGAGTLTGGTAGADGVRLAELSDGIATISYTPPDQAATDELVVALEDSAGGLGVEIGRFPLRVQAA